MSASASNSPFGAWSNPLLAAAVISLWFALAFLFNANPAWDLAVSARFFDRQQCLATAGAASCAGFPVATWPLARAVREVLNYAPVVIGLALAGLLLLDLRGGRRWSDPAFRARLVVLAALLIGPVLIVNGILKAEWGRPRPHMTDLFGGTMPFVPAGVMEGLCQRNCSFVSGEGSAGGWFLALAVLFPPAMRRPVFAVLAVTGLSMAWLRVAFGAHYLSDAMLGWLLSVAVFSVLACLAEASVRQASTLR